LVRNFKAGDVLATHIAANLMQAALLQRARQLLRRSSRWWLVPAPGHLAGPAGRPLDHFCRELSANVSWVFYRPGLLLRTRQIRQSSNSATRPSVAEHLKTLRWAGGWIDYSIIMVDDVYTLGHTSKACRVVLGNAGAYNVIVACLAATRR
jgi:predicted amidophosphoribosyltransferase